MKLLGFLVCVPFPELVSLAFPTFHPNRNPDRGKDGISLTKGEHFN